MDIKGLHRLGLLITDPATGGVAVVNGHGWTEVPAPLREVVLRALADDGGDDDAAA